MGESCNCLLNAAIEVPFRGPATAKIVFVGESPGFEEVNHTPPRCWVGAAGRELSKQILDITLLEEDIFFANSARCMIDKDRLSQKQVTSILTSCRPNLKVVIHSIKPKLIVALGGIALQQVSQKKGITKHRGKFLWSSEFNCYVLPTWHPAYILRNKSEEENFIRDFNTIQSFIDSGYQIPSIETNFTWKEVDSIRPLLDGGFYQEDGFMVTAIDTETQGVFWYEESSITISYSVAASLTEGHQIYLYELAEDDENAEFELTFIRGSDTYCYRVKKSRNFDQKMEELKELSFRSDIKKYFMNQKFDTHRLRLLGVDEINNANLDIAVAAHVLNSKFAYSSLEELTEYFTNVISHKEMMSKAEKSDMLMTSYNDRGKVSKYAAMDAVDTLVVGLELKRRLMKDPKSMRYFALFVQPVETEFLYELEKNGVLIDVDRIEEVRDEIKVQMDRLGKKFKTLCPNPVIEKHGENFKLTKRTALTDALFSYVKEGEVIDIGYGITPPKLSPKTRLPSTGKEVFKELLDLDIPRKAKELIRAHTKWGTYSDLLTRYIVNIESHMSPQNRIHPSYTSTATVSGRTGAKNPSIHNFPKRSEEAKLIRKLIIAPPGRKLLEADFSMAELRFIAHVANETTMKKIFKADGDIHLETGLNMSGKDRNSLTSKELKKIRQSAKAINFGLPYGMSAFGLRNYAYHNYNIRLSSAKAVEWKDKFFARYRNLSEWHFDTKDRVKRDGYIRHVFGRKFHLPNIYSSHKATRAEAERLAINLQIQGPSSDYALMGGRAAINDEQFDKNEAFPIIFSHDAITFEVDEDKIQKYAQIIKTNLENIDISAFGFKLTVPFKVNLEIGDNLAEMKKLELTGGN